jgi:hypothetical protein
MATPQEAQGEVLAALSDHFDRTAEYLKPQQIAEMTALPFETVTNALRVLHQANMITGMTAAEFDFGHRSPASSTSSPKGDSSPLPSTGEACKHCH